MAEGLHADLLTAALVTLLAAALLVRGKLGLGLALSLAGVRVLVPLVFFASLDTGAWRLTDDRFYFECGQVLLGNGFDPLSLILNPDGSRAMALLAGGPHVGYIWLNAFAHWLFGGHYWAPVFLNVAASFLAARFFCALLADTGYSSALQRLGGVLFLLHWDLIAWSSFVNLKDILVMTFTTGMFAGTLHFLTQRRKRGIAVAIACGLPLLTIRWYVPIFFTAAVAGWSVLALSGTRRLLFIGLGVAVFVAKFKVKNLRFIQIENPAFGVVHFLLSPQPWKVDPTYSFLTLPSALHWMLLPLAAWGLVRLWKRGPATRLVVLYFLGMVAFYSVVPNLRGPRHRVQLSALLIWAQLEGCAAWFRQWRAHAAPPPPAIRPAIRPVLGTGPSGRTEP